MKDPNIAKVVSALIMSEYNKGETVLLEQLKKIPEMYDLKHGEKFDILAFLKGKNRLDMKDLKDWEMFVL